MTDISYIVFRNSFQANLLIPFHAEYAWVAARIFGCDMLQVTAMAVLGATLAMSISFYIGYWLSARRVKRFNLSEETYQKISRHFRRYVYLLLLFPTVAFLGLIAVACGFFRVRPPVAIGMIALGRIGYYGYLLLHTA